MTQLLARWRDGDQGAFDELVPLVYDQLRIIAGRCFRGEQPGLTLRPTALVHEAYLRLAGSSAAYQDRVHLFAVAARMMRRILVDHARSHFAQKRGGNPVQVDLDDAVMISAEPSTALLALDQALERLQVFDPRKASLVEMVYFGGMTLPEAGEALALSQATLYRDLSFAKAWLQKTMLATESS